MTAQIIEKLDRQRYWAVAIEAVGLLSMIIESIAMYIKNGATPECYMLVVGGGLLGLPYLSIGLPLLIAGGIWYFAIWLKVKRNPIARKALYNEMHRENKCRYQRYSMWAMIIAGIVSMFVVPFRYPFPAVVQIIIFSGLLTMKVSWLILNRR